jgi:hypothetical protein|tara:strand:- start:305 stop:547 length:243 start_codon:yes stop_codon:yes gene_type:complete
MKSSELRKNKLASQLETVCGEEVEITVIDETRFSFLIEGEKIEAMKKLVDFLEVGNQGEVESLFDEECDCCFIYLTVKEA